MIPYLGCDAARVMLEPFADGELPIDGQVALDAHLRWCDTCRARLEDLRLIATALRSGPGPRAIPAADQAALAAVQAGVLGRICAERAESFAVRWREMWVDNRFLWPIAGATAAMMLCVLAIAPVAGVVRAERPDSLAALIAGRAPLPTPRPLPPPPAPVVAPEGEAVFLLSAAVAHGGARVATYELLQSEGEPAAEVSALVEALGDVKFEPPTPGHAGQVVWLVARTTVRGSGEPVERPLSDGARPAPRHARS